MCVIAEVADSSTLQWRYVEKLHCTNNLIKPYNAAQRSQTVLCRRGRCTIIRVTSSHIENWKYSFWVFVFAVIHKCIFGLCIPPSDSDKFLLSRNRCSAWRLFLEWNVRPRSLWTDHLTFKLFVWCKKRMHHFGWNAIYTVYRIFTIMHQYEVPLLFWSPRCWSIRLMQTSGSTHTSDWQWLGTWCGWMVCLFLDKGYFISIVFWIISA